MPPTRTKHKASPRDGQKHRQRRGQTEENTSALPGVQKIKASIRQTKRLLAKDKLAADVRVETERRLKALESDLEKAELGRKERHFALKYHKVKFFERQKVIRKINQVKRRLASDEGNSDGLESTLYELRVDLNYILHYPKTKKYISLFPPEVRKGDVPSEGQQANAQRDELRSWVRVKMNEGEILATPEEDMNSQAVGVTAARPYVLPRNGKATQKGETRMAKLADHIEQDAFFGGAESSSDSE